jgi:large subunit ribosomal protein L17
MRHRKKTVKLQRRKDHREALLSNLCKSLIEHRRIKTTLAKAKALRPVAEKLCTLGKKAITAKGKDAQQTTALGVHYRRMAYRTLQNETLVKKLVDEIATASLDRVGGYTRITKLGQRMSDSAPMAFIEWVDAFVPPSSQPQAEEGAEDKKDDTDEAKGKKKKAAKADKGETADKPAKAKKAKAKTDE